MRILIVVLACSVAGAAVAQAPSPAAEAALRQAFRAAAERACAPAAAQPSGSADLDYARAVLPVKEAEAALARLAFAHGSDRDIRKLARKSIAAREREIAFLRQWIKEHAR